MAKTDDREFTLKEYDCGYCKNVWRQFVRRTGGTQDQIGRSDKSYSSQVQCPRCKNGCKTWEEGKEIETTIIKGNAYQRIVESIQEKLKA